MSEHFPAYIKIGGDLVAADLDNFLLAIQRYDLRIGEWYSDYPTKEGLIAASDQSRPLYLYDDSAPFGQFEELEAFCESHQLTYRRASDAFNEWNAEIVYYDPIRKRTYLCLGTQDGDPAITLTDLLQHQKAGHTLEVVIATMSRFQASLPPFRLIFPSNQKET